MNYNNFIRKILAVVMLNVFAFSVTPKIILHNLVADHRDTPRSQNHSKDQQLSKTGFNCNCDNLVVESPFTDDQKSVQIIISSFFLPQAIENIQRFNAGHHFYFLLQRPPVNQPA